MLTPCTNTRLKRKRVETRTRTRIRHRDGEEQDVNVNETANTNEGLVPTTPLPLAHPPQNQNQNQNERPRAIFIIENASLKKGLVKKKWRILCSYRDANFLRKQNKNLNDYRPDIAFEAARTICDSTLYKKGLIGSIFVKTDQGVLFEIKPHVRIPRTCRRFCGLIMELYDKSCVRAKESNEVLLHVVEEPVAHHLPAQSRIIGLSYGSQKLVDMENYLSLLSDDVTPVFVVGAMVNGHVKRDLAHDYISVSQFPLSAKYCIGIICDALEDKYKIF